MSGVLGPGPPPGLCQYPSRRGLPTPSPLVYMVPDDPRPTYVRLRLSSRRAPTWTPLSSPPSDPPSVPSKSPEDPSPHEIEIGLVFPCFSSPSAVGLPRLPSKLRGGGEGDRVKPGKTGRGHPGVRPFSP